MEQEKFKRKDFFKNIIGLQKKEADSTIVEDGPGGGSGDPLFDKYSRKTLGNRQYSETIAIPNAEGPTSSLRAGNITTGIAPYTGQWTVWEVTHLLRRVGFGIKKAEKDALLAKTPSAAVDGLLTLVAPANPSPTPLNYYQATLADTGGILLGNSWTSNNLAYGTNPSDGTLNSYRQLSLTSWSWGLCINENTTIREKMVLFWYHFIPVDFDDVRGMQNNSATMCNDYMNLLRNNALGNFKTLIKAIGKSPAMLVFLGNQYSTAATPNENFARELMELFTLGKTPTQNYTEDDVKAASKVFSGWRLSSFVAPYPFNPAYNNSYHTQGSKVFSTFFNQTIANAGAAEYDTFFDMLFTKQALTVAKYICRRLYRFFVYYDIDANIETRIIAPLADLLIANNWEMRIVVSTLFKSEHFFDMANRGVVIKNPIDFMVGTVRNFGMNTTPVAGATQLANQYAVWNYFQSYGNNYLEQAYGLVPNVSGWKAYYQDPTYYQNWINSNTIQRRSSLLTAFLGNGVSAGGLVIKIDVIAFVQQFAAATIADPDLLIEAIVQLLFAVDLPAQYKTDTKIQTLLNGQVTNSYWTVAWNAYVATPNTANLNIVKPRLTSLITTFVQLAEYQLM